MWTQHVASFVSWVASEPVQKVLQNLLALAALIAAVRGVGNWNAERRDLRRADLAETALALAYKVKDVFEGVRSPVGFSGEGKTREREPDEDAAESKDLDAAYVPIERLQTMQKSSRTFQPPDTTCSPHSARNSPLRSTSF